MNYYPYQYQQYQPQIPLPTQNVGFNANQMMGKVVANYNEITANDVPMNGNYAYFPKADMSEIAVKNWNSQGRIETHVYRLSEPNTEPLLNDMDNSSSDELKDVLQGFNTRLDKIEKLLTNNKARGKKNESTDADTTSAE